MLLPGQELHETGAHPENGERLPAVLAHLKASEDWSRFSVLTPDDASLEDIARVHSSRLIDQIEVAALTGPTWIDGDTVVSPQSFNIALKAAGAAITAVDAVSGPGVAGSRQPGQPDGPDLSSPTSTFALIRPPGHHARPDQAMGFCLFNNAAVAARYAQEKLGLDKVAILDWDVHHGNGTQDAFFGDPSVLFISTHQWPLYPGTGWLGETGSGEGQGFTVNLPMPPGSGDAEHLEAMDRIIEPVLNQFEPDLLIVSAGQDGHAGDQLANQMISASGFNELAGRTARFSQDRGIGLVALHEGGYNLETLPRLDHAILAGLGNFETDLREPAEIPSVETDWETRLEEIRRVQSKYWNL